MKKSDVLVVEISGKRPGTSAQRKTEKMQIDFDHLIISNNSDGYITDWKIVMVPDDYREWYISNHKNSDNAWYAPMNRSYAIKYAREHGYKYLVQMDDNITNLEICYKIGGKKYRATGIKMINDYIEMLVCVLENTNAAVSGCQLMAIERPQKCMLAERYCYSLFCLNLETCPSVFHGDYEDDIEYRLKCAELGLPEVQVCPLRYGKTGQKSNKDETGNRAAYTAVGLKRGEHMRKIHGDVYSCGSYWKTSSFKCNDKGSYFQHRLKPFKVGVQVKDMDAINRKMSEILVKNAQHQPDKVVVKEKKKKDAR